MTNRDDMVMRPRIGPEKPNSPRQRAEEERRTVTANRKRRRIMSRLQRARAARRLAKARTGRRKIKASKGVGGVPGAKAGAKKIGNKVAARAVPFVGWAILAAELINAGGQLARRIEGKSARLVEAEDAHTLMGDLDEEATANVDALAFVEGNRDMLAAIGREGKITNTMANQIATVKELARQRAHGADLINRDPHFDSPDSLIDKFFAAFQKAGIQDDADRVIMKAQVSGIGRLIIASR